MGFRQIVIFRRQVARKILKSSNEAVQSRHGLCPYSVGENHARHSTDWSWYLQSPSQTPVYLPCLHVDKDNDEKYNPHKVINLLYLPAKQLVRLPERKLLRDATTAELLRDARELVLPLGVRWMSHSTRSSSTATASQHAISSQEDDKEEHALKKRQIEASPEECDQAVEGLSTAKAKAKQVHESQKRDENFVRKFWSRLIGIGPALRAVASMSREDWAQKLQQWRKDFSAAMQHYWIGTKLMWADVRICFRLLLKLASGKSLSRRERQQLTRTTADIFRLVPFAVFIIVPFLEFLLPVFLKVFPNMLPSTFQDKMKEEEELKHRLHARIEYAKFLQDTVKEMAKEIKTSCSGELKQTAEDLDDFMNKVRKGAKVSNEEILGFAKLFNDELTLDNISRPRLVNMCKYMGIKPYGTDAYLRYILRSKLARIKEDDRLIQREGVESLSETELRQACRDRGMLGLLSIEEMRQQVDAMLQMLEKEIDDVDAKIGDRWHILDRDMDGKVTPEEVAAAALYLRDTLGQEPVQKFISNLAKDKDGRILVEDIVRLGTRVDDSDGQERDPGQQNGQLNHGQNILCFVSQNK